MSDSTRKAQPDRIHFVTTGDPENWIITSGSGSATYTLPSQYKVYLITGGTGSLGTALTKHLLAAGHKVRVYARNEHRHEDLERQIPEEQRPRLSCLIGAVEDGPRLKRAMRGVDYVIHAAAMKVVPLCEYNPAQAVLTNVSGTSNVMEACLDGSVKRCVLVSTDKARGPSTLYGATKLAAERLWLASNLYRGGEGGVFSAVAYGNVFGSRGSVLHAFNQQASSGGLLQVTDPASTRFHISLEQAVRFVLDAVDHAEPGTLWIPKLPSYRVGDFATAFSRVYGLTKEPVITGLRPAEKRHEDLISENESYAVKGDSGCTPASKDGLTGHYVLEPGKVHCQGGWSYNSGSNPWKLSIAELEKEIRAWARP